MEAVAIRGRRTAAIALLVVVAFLAQGVRAPNANAATPRRDAMLSLTNHSRALYDRRALLLNSELSGYAARHSRAMARRGRLFHTADLASRLNGVDWSAGGENVGFGGSLASLEKAFMHSKDHRDNILNRSYDHVAIGVFVDADGLIWVTVIFYG